MNGANLGIVWLHTLEAATDLAGRLKQAGVSAALPATSFPVAGSGQHVADHLLATLAPLGAHPTRPTIQLDRVSLPVLGDRGRPPLVPVGAERLVVLHPGAGGRRKRWPAERFAAIADRLRAAGYVVALTSGPSDERRCRGSSGSGSPGSSSDSG